MKEVLNLRLFKRSWSIGTLDNKKQMHIITRNDVFGHLIYCEMVRYSDFL